MGLHYIDIGINLMHRSFAKDRTNVMEEGKAVGVNNLIITGTSVASSLTAAKFAGNHPNTVYSTAGVHPHDAKSCTNTTIAELRKLTKLPQVVAVGECGLDYDREFSPRPVQRKWFEAQIALAEEEAMPLFLHERAAFTDFKAILSHHKDICARSVVHCFTGTRAELETYLNLGCFIGITGWICDERRGKHLRDLVKLIPADKIIIETDAPYLTPRNLPTSPANNRNEPQYLPHIAQEIADCRGESLETFVQKATANSKTFFGLSENGDN